MVSIKAIEAKLRELKNGEFKDYGDLVRELSIFADETSRDRSTRNAAAILGPDDSIVSLGVNDLAPGVEPLTARMERPLKYSYFIHAEVAAIANAARLGASTEGCTIVSPWAACSMCSNVIVHSGAARLVTVESLVNQQNERWSREIQRGHEILREGGVEIILLDQRQNASMHLDGMPRNF